MARKSKKSDRGPVLLRDLVETQRALEAANRQLNVALDNIDLSERARQEAEIEKHATEMRKLHLEAAAGLKRAAERPVLVQFVDGITGIGAADSVVLTAAVTNGRGGGHIITVPMSLLNAAAKIVADLLVNAGSLPVVGDVAGRKRD